MSRLIQCYAECHYGECHYAECRYAECRGAMFKCVSSNLCTKTFYDRNYSYCNRLDCLPLKTTFTVV